MAEQIDEQDVTQGTMMSTERVLTLTDGIFAIAMTLLVLAIDVPSPDKVPGGPELQRYLISLWPQVTNYFLSFFLLAVFWIGLHRSSHLIIRTNEKHLWINIGMLMFVCLVPFSASLSGEYPADVEPQLIFHANMVLIGLFYLGNWIYSAYGHRLIDVSFPEYKIHRIALRISVFPLVALVAFFAAFFMPAHACWLYLFIPVIMKHMPIRK